MITTYKIELKEENMECVLLLRSIKDSEMAYGVFFFFVAFYLYFVSEKENDKTQLLRDR